MAIRPISRYQRRNQPVSAPMTPEDVALIDRAAAIRDESRSQFIRRVAIREARALVRRSERETASPAA